jgi:hypothetical protein
MLLLSTTAQAQIRYVAATGNDASPCTSVSASCRTLQRGIQSAPAGGEVRVLGPTAVGGGTIDKSLTISGAGATINGRIRITNANAIVALRDLHLNGSGRFDIGIWVVAASAVHIERCTIERFTEDGIFSGGPNAEIFVTDSISRDNGGAGLNVQDGSAGAGNLGSTMLAVDNSRFLNNGGGVLIYQVTAAFSRSILSGNQGHGISLTYGIASFADTIASDNERGAGYAFFESKGTLDSSIADRNNSGLLGVGETPGVVVISNSTLQTTKTPGFSHPMKPSGREETISFWAMA